MSTCLSRGQPAQSHSEICRNRIIEQLRKDNDLRLNRGKGRMDIEAEEIVSRACPEARAI